jgi:anion-transporting  ArsA/GET3 family ATPase
MRATSRYRSCSAYLQQILTQLFPAVFISTPSVFLLPIPADFERPAAMSRLPPVSEFPAVKLHVVSGKGGTGKTTVAAALALALAAGGRQVLLTEVEGRQGIAQLFDTPPLPYEERKVAVARGGGEVYALAIDPEQALLEYLEQFYNLRRAGSMLKRLGAIDFATTIAPGMRDVLLTGKVMEATTRERRGGGRLYDAVVMDAPPTGRIARFLNVNTEVAALARMGPVRQQADSVMALLRSSKTVVHLVTVLEEMPVQETIDGATQLRDTHLPVGAVLVNMVREPLLPDDALEAAAAGKVDKQALRRGLKAASLDADAALVTALAGEAADHAGRVLLERRERARLTELRRPTYELPLIDDAADLSGLYELAGHLHDVGMV